MKFYDNYDLPKDPPQRFTVRELLLAAFWVGLFFFALGGVL